jgi:hypothetical protein
MFLQSVSLQLTHLIFQVAEIINHDSNKQAKGATEQAFSSCTLLSILGPDTDHSL